MKPRGLVLAAGSGTRLEPKLGYVKFYHKVGGLPLICYPIASMALAGVGEVVVATRRERLGTVRGVLAGCPAPASVEVVDVDMWWAGNAWTLLDALSSLGRGLWLVSMSDHIFTPALAGKVAGGCGRPVCVGGDSKPLLVDVGEATKIDARGGVVRLIGKNVEPWTHVDVGVHLLEWGPLIGECVSMPLTLNDLNQCNADRGLVGLVDVTGEPWTDVDTPEDLESVTRGPARRVVEIVKGWLALA